LVAKHSIAYTPTRLEYTNHCPHMAGYNQTSIRIDMTMTFLARLRYVALLFDIMSILWYKKLPL